MPDRYNTYESSHQYSLKPKAEAPHDPGQQTTLSNSQKRTDDHEARVVLHKPQAHRNNPPGRG